MTLLSKYASPMVAFIVSLVTVTPAAALHITERGAGHVSGFGGASRLVNDSGSQTLQCTSSGIRATLRHRTNGSPIVTISHIVLMTKSGCTIGGVVGITVSCNNASLNVTGGTATAIHGTVTNIFCDIRLGTGTTSTCHVRTLTTPVGATLRVNYNNAGRLSTVPGGATNIQLTGSLAGCSLKNSTRARLSNSLGTASQEVISPSVTVHLS
jgi:hypothetical protein